MVALERIVEQVVGTYQAVYGTMCVIAIGGTVLQQEWFALAYLAVGLPIGYWLGIKAIGFILPKLLTTDFMLMEFRRGRIELLNQKLASGELVADSPELAEEMRAAGLKPLSVIVEKGPVFARQYDADLYEWVDAKEGDGEVGRYFYVGEAQFDPEDGTVKIDGDDENKMHLVLDGFLYERTLQEDPEVAHAE